MVIDLPASSQIIPRGNQNPVTQVVNQRLESLLTALKALNIQSGETLIALVKAVHPVNDTLRARLIQQATPPSAAASAGAQRNATAPEPASAKAPDAGKVASPEVLKLLNAATLKLVEIEVQGKPLLTFTDRALRPGQTLTLQLHLNRLVIVGDTPADKLAAPAYQTFLSTTLSSTLPTALATTPATAPNTAASTAGPGLPGAAQPLLNSAQLETLHQTLRAQLPTQAAPQFPAASAISSSLQLAQLLTQLIQQPGSETLQQQIPRSVQESLQQLAAHLRSPQQLASPPNLKQAILGGGLQLEHQLRQALTNASPGQPAALPQTDLKAALLQTLHQLSQPLGSGGPAATSAATPALPGAAITTPPASPATQALALIPVLQQLIQGSALQRQAAAGKLSAEKLLQATQHQVQQALDKIQYLQLQTLQKQSLQHARPHQEGLNTVHLQLEIPVNWGVGAHSVALSIDEDWVTDYTGAEDDRKEKVQQWQVKLTFELPEAGSLHAHLTVIREQLSASLWAEHADTFAKTRAALVTLRQQLEKDGCEVKQLECFLGRPVVEEPMRLNYSLIDIQT